MANKGTGSKGWRSSATGELQAHLNEVAGRPVGFKKRIRFNSNRDAKLYRAGLYDCRRRTVWPEGVDPWADIIMQVDGPFLILSRHPGKPSWLPEPIEG